MADDATADTAASKTDEPKPARALVVLAGNPNVGKTTLFNALTGLSAKVSNYPGITVERRSGRLALPEGREADVHDLPGTYSLNARSAEEQIAFDAIVGVDGQPVPDAAVVCIDATQLARSAYLLLQIQELGVRCVVALTMVDEAGASAPDAAALAALLGCEVVAVTARTRTGLSELAEAIARATHAERRAIWTWEPEGALATGIAEVRAALPAAWMTRARFGAPVARGDDALALWALSSVEPRKEISRSRATDDDTRDDDELEVPQSLRVAVERAVVGFERATLDAPILARWRFLDRELPKLVAKPPDRTRTERIDRVLLHRVAGFGVFLGVMAVVFMSLFAWSAPAIDGIDRLFKWLGDVVREWINGAPAEDPCAKLHAATDARSIFTDFLVDGVIAGVGAVMVFLPQILLLFLFLGFLEDCGYLARVAYLMDRIMRSMNLHGRAFVPMLSGFACAIPAIMATRTMERRRDRILTMMVVPLMTCSARLPVYTLVIAALIPGSSATQALLMVGMYLFSVSTALAAAWLMSRTVKPLKARRLPFLIELPPYRLPRVRDVLRQMASRASMFLREAGTVILVCSIALWALLAFPRDPAEGHADRVAACAVAEADDEKQAIVDAESGARLANSYGGRLGQAVEPALAPLGFDWKIDVGIIGAFAAREVFVSTLGIVYSVGGEADESSEPLRDALRNAKKPDGSPAYTPLVGLTLMIFFALACQCMSTLAVVRRETRSWKWPLFLFSYMTSLAWIVGLLVYQVGKLLGFG